MNTQLQIQIMIVYSPAPRRLHTCVLRLPCGASVRDALAAGALHANFESISKAQRLGVWGKNVALNHVLVDQDRLEIYRPLRVDPKVARRERYKKQGAKSAGLFAKRRPGAKPGY